MQNTIQNKPLIIKRYANRKLYNTSTSSYITIDELAILIRKGVSIKVLENKTNNDITSMTLASIVLETEKKTNRQGSARVLESIIKKGSIGDFLNSDKKEDKQKEVLDLDLSSLESKVYSLVSKYLSETQIKKLLKIFNEYVNFVVNKLKYEIDKKRKLDARKVISLKKELEKVKAERDSLIKRQINKYK